MSCITAFFKIRYKYNVNVYIICTSNDYVHIVFPHNGIQK